MFEEVFEEDFELEQKNKQKKVIEGKEKTLKEIMNRTHFNKYELEEYMSGGFD